MNVFTGEQFTPLYLEILSAFREGHPPLFPSRIGNYFELGHSIIELSGDGSRWCLLPGRALNPFFALFEISWILSGSNRLEGLQYFIRDYGKYSDDGETLTGAYGYRLRKYFGVDQIERVIDVLDADPASRRSTLALWSVDDLGRESRDIPCNVLVNVKVRAGRLDVSVANRSNDAFLGVPYNILQFNALQKYLAWRLGVEVGTQVHFIDSLHLYESTTGKVDNILLEERTRQQGGLPPSIRRSDLSEYVPCDHEYLATHYDEPSGEENQFLRVRDSYIHWRSGKRELALDMLPKTEIGIVAAQWYRSRPDFTLGLPGWLQEMNEHGD